MNFDKNEIIKKYFGYQLKQEQADIIDNVLNNKDVIGLLPTGFGKSVTFQVPALMLDGLTIVISPLIALMQDQVMSLKRRGIPSEYINSLQDNDSQDKIYEALKRNEIKILYVSAERLKSTRFLNEILNIDISLLVCDEAHTLLWSEDFREALGDIPLFIKKLRKRPKMLALTATATEITVSKITKFLSLNNPVVIKGDCDRKNIFYRNIKTNDKDRDLYFYVSRKKGMHGLIYALTIKQCEHIYNFLREKNINAALYHGALDSKIKKKVLEDYISHKIDVVVCTQAFGMGVDVSDVRYVIEYDMPQSIEDYLQQTGRGSRDGKYAEGILYFNSRDIETIEYFIDNISSENKSDKEIKIIKADRYKKLDKMVNYALSKKCLHGLIADYFGFKHKGKCMMCSNCKKNDYE